jgi:site-specific DNA-methyltransferase (adenine-specific)
VVSPYYEDEQVTLYHGRFEEILPTLDLHADLILTDPPYGETSLGWDRWPDGWPSIAAAYSRSMWCFGSMRMFLDRRAEFTDWKMSQDVVWEKNRGSGFATDRFSRVHEHVVHWYRGEWREIHHETPRVARTGPPKHVTRRSSSPHTGAISNDVPYVDDGLRLHRSVIFHRNLQGTNPINPTQKPIPVLTPLVEYASPRGGVVMDLFAGSCSTLVAARDCGRRAIGFEVREEQCEAAARRLSQQTLDIDGGAA